MDAQEFLNQITPLPYLVPDGYPEETLEKRMGVLLVIAETLCKGFLLDSETKRIYENAILYFNADSRSSFDLNKGLYLWSSVGTGKTTFFKIFQKFNEAYSSKNNFNILSINDLTDGFSEEGNKFFSTSGISRGNMPRFYYPDGNIHLMLDDLGQSSRFATHFGSTINVVIDTLSRRYNAFKDNASLTHIATNLPPQKIEAEYGKFTASRLREMVNVVYFPGEDKRK
jgi:hypothetical protein